MAQYAVGKLYRAGSGGVTITWPDGSSTAYSARELIYLRRTPVKVQGRIFRSRRRGVLEYEAPALVPEKR